MQMSATSSTDKTLSQLEGLSQEQQKITKYSYLNPQYVLRYEFTFKSMQWAFILGVFFGLHTHIRHRNIARSFRSFLMGSFGLIFPFWAFFYTKYNFYQSSIQKFQEEEQSKIKKFEMFKFLAEHKLGLKKDHELDEEEVIKRYEEYLKDYEYKNCQLDIVLEGVNDRSYDLVKP